MSALRPIRWTYPQHTGSGLTFVPNLSTTHPDIEQYFRQLASRLKDFDVVINHNLPHLLHGCLKEWIHRFQKLHLRVIYRYLNEIERVLSILNSAPNELSNEKLQNNVKIELNRIMNDLTQDLEVFQAKARFINDLEGQNFRYNNVGTYDLNKVTDTRMLERVLINDYTNNRILCSNDILNSSNQSKLKILLHRLVEERKTNANLRLTYADFSYCTSELSDIVILPSMKQTNTQNIPKQTTPPIKADDDDIINILLLGETGIGKSTFINALLNYLTFDSLQQAQSNNPVVVIPVSFLVTTGDNFQEHTVKFGDFDSSHNEDFDHPGQSVTQRCKSYIFHLDSIDGRKVRIIDTPGFGDTRGVDRDHLNIQHILEYLNSLSHLNAICYLLKPNVSRLSISFRTCLTQLLDFLGPRAHQNILFCFTNARTTFYTPGDSAPLLRTMLNSSPFNNIRFNKANTFCFDNESFRYLVASQNGIQFNDEEKEEYEVSWSTAVNESNRLLTYIRTELMSYPLRSDWQSVRDAQLQIDQMVRPMLETMKNILRNLILWNTNLANKSVKLCPQVVRRPSAFCALCIRDPFQLNGFWILPDDPHEFRNKCFACSCPSNEHTSVDYILGYDTVKHHASDEQKNQMKGFLEQLCVTCVEFAYFLLYVARSCTEDPFLNGLEHSIREEKQMCAEYESNQLNSRLLEELEKIRSTYREQTKPAQFKQNNRNLQFIYERIRTIGEYPVIREQIAAIHEHRTKYKDEQQEFNISKNSIHRKIYLSTEC